MKTDLSSVFFSDKCRVVLDDLMAMLEIRMTIVVVKYKKKESEVMFYSVKISINTILTILNEKLFFYFYFCSCTLNINLKGNST